MHKWGLGSVGAALILAGLAWRAVWFDAGARHLPVSSDESLTVLQAKHIRAGDMQLFFMGQPYIFPIESYLQAPLVNRLPRTPRGARLPALLLGLAGLGCSLAILFRLHPGPGCWPGALLLLFPSSYLLLHQAVYAMPGYPALLFCGSASILAALYAGHWKWCAPAAGLIAGAGFSAHALMFPALLTAGYFCLCPPAPCSARRGAGPGPSAPRLAPILLFAGGVLAGLLPWLLGLWLHPGHHGAVFGRWDALTALRRVWSPAIRYTLPAAMGIAPVPFPDNAELHPWPILETIFLAVWILLVLGGLAVLTAGAIRRRRARRPDAPVMEAAAAPFYGITLLTLVLFAFSRRADSGSFRYLLPLVWCFPFIIQHWFAAGPRRLRPVIGLLTAGLALLNIASAGVMASAWRAENFTAEAGFPDLRPALDFLRRHNFQHCVASYGAAYRINFLTDEAILCSQPVNERFPEWPIPYKATVDAAPRAAYALTSRIRFLKPEVFERHLRLMHVGCERAQCGDFEIYYDFRELPRDPPSIPAPAGELTITASHNPAQAARLARAEQAGGWTSQTPQAPGMRLELQWPETLPVHRVELIQTNDNHCTPATLDVSVWRSNQWQTVLMDAEPEWGKFVFRNGRPVYGIEPRILQWPPAQTDRLRLEIRRPHSNQPWVIDAIRIFHMPQRPAP